MSALRFLTSRWFSPRVVAPLMAMAMIAAGIGFPPVIQAGSSIDTDEQQSDSQPCEESPEESAEDEESSAGKHASILGVALPPARPTVVGFGDCGSSFRLHAGPLASAAPIRGPPAAA